MVRRTGSPKRKRLSEEQLQEMLRMRRQGQSIKTIAEAIGCHRQTVRLHLQERQGEILAGEVRKQVLTDEVQKHLDDLTQFAVSFKSYLTIPSSPTEDRDAATVFKPLLGEDLPQGVHSDSQKARREQRQINRRNKMLLMSLREHTRDRGWWVAYEEWRQAWDTCIKGLLEIQKQAAELVREFFDQKANLKKEVEKVTGKEDVLERISEGVVWTAWQVATASNPEEELELRNFRVLPSVKQLRVTTGSYELRLIFTETVATLAQEVAAVCNAALRILYPQYMADEVLGKIRIMDEKIEKIDDTLDPFVLRPLLVRTRCDLCPV